MSNLSFDTYQFDLKRHYAVHAEFDGHEFQSPGIAFEDYARMSTQTHRLAAGRHGAAPDWVFNNDKLRAVIVGCVESRAFLNAVKHFRYGTDAERLARAQQKLAKDKPNLEARIDLLCKQYMAAKRASDAAQTKFYAQKVEEVDTQLRLIENPAKYYVGAAYHYWRAGLNSVETAQELGIKPPHVRCLLWRMGRVAGELGYGPAKNVRHRVGRTPSTGQALRKPEPETEELLAVAKAVIEKERRRKITATMTGRKRAPISQAQKQKISATMTGRSLSEAHKQNIAAGNKGRVVSQVTREKISAAHLAAEPSRSKKLIPLAERLPLVVKMHGEGAKSKAIARALGWGQGSNGKQDGYGMVKRLMTQAGLR